MLRLGDKSISKLFLGDRPILKAYLGDKLVFNASKPLFLDYVIFDGDSYIDTGYKPNPNTSATCIYYPYYNTVFSCIFGTQDSTTSNRFYGVLSSTLYRVQVNSCKGNLSYYGISSSGLRTGNNGDFASLQEKVALTIDNYNKQISVVSNELTKTYDTETYSTQYHTPNCKYSLLLGNRSTAGVPTTTNGFKGEIYGLQIKENDVLIQDLRPCVDPKGVVCFYDMVTKKYFYNQGTGTLKAGGRFVESIIFDGASYIDTGITQQTCKVECGIKFTNADTRQLMGFHSSNGGYWGCRNASGRYEASGGLLSTAVSALDYNDVVIDYNCDDVTAPFVRVTVKDITTSVAGTAVFTTKNYTIGALLNSSTVASYHMTGQVYYNKFYIGGELVQNLKPYVDENGVACFKDVVTNTLFYNKGTGTLGYTE